MEKKLQNDSKEKEMITAQPSWHCDIYCRKIRHIDCEGRKYRDENAPDLCPYFDEMLF